MTNEQLALLINSYRCRLIDAVHMIEEEHPEMIEKSGNPFGFNVYCNPTLAPVTDLIKEMEADVKRLDHGPDKS